MSQGRYGPFGLLLNKLMPAKRSNSQSGAFSPEWICTVIMTRPIFFSIRQRRLQEWVAIPVILTSQARLTINIEYWRDLGESVFFRGHTLGDCIARIHDDVLKVWNFNDPLKVSACYRQTKGNDFDVHSPATFRSGILRRDDKTCRTFT